MSTEYTRSESPVISDEDLAEGDTVTFGKSRNEWRVRAISPSRFYLERQHMSGKPGGSLSYKTVHVSDFAKLTRVEYAEAF